MNLRDVIKLEEDMFPKTFTNYIEKDFGFLFFNEQTKNSWDSNHALIYKSKITDLDQVLDVITAFYKDKNINPNIYQAMEDEGFFKEKEDIFQKHGYKVWVEGPNKFMVMTSENTIKSNHLLDITLLQEWDERIATDICIPSDESHEIEVVKNSIANKDYSVFVGYHNGKAVGITYFHRSDDCTRFDYVIVTQEERGKGYARELLSFVTDYCRKEKLKNCFQWPAHSTSERICYEAGFRELFSAEAGRASYGGK